MRASPPVPPEPKWAMRVLPGLLGGILLTLIQLCVVLLGSRLDSQLGFPFFPHSAPIVYFLLLLFYLVIPALLAFLVTSWTRQPPFGYKAGRFAGVLCAVLLMLATLTYPPSWLDISPVSSGGHFISVAGLGRGFTIMVLYVLSLLYHVVGIQLAMLGAALGSRKGKREVFLGSRSED
jgi:hypothetical protein